MGSTVSERVTKYRAGLRAAGMRPIQIWVPDIRAEGFAEECRRQSSLAAEHDHRDIATLELLDQALSDLDEAAL
ncbi:MAG: hypothetical protein RL194_227 [Pseudomonadota bacterium]